jgi:hypothetical protein
MTKLPRGPKTLLNKVGNGWTHWVQHASADVELTALSTDEDGDGHRHRIVVTESVDSIGVRFDHPDGRAAVALWWKRAGKASYAFAGAVRGRHADENVPRELNAKALGVYLSEDQ